MNILMLLYNQKRRGTYWRALGFAKQLVKNGVTVTMMVTSENLHFGFAEYHEDGVKIVETPDWLPGKLRSGWDFYGSLRRIGWLKQHKYDLIHGFESRPVVIWPALEIRKKLKIPLILDWADWFGKGGSVEQRINPIERTILRPAETFFENHYRARVEAATVICSTLQNKVKNLGMPVERTLLLPNGADVDHIVPQDRSKARIRMGLPVDVPIIAYTGAIFKQDAELMISAFKIVRSSLPDAHLLLIGYTPAYLGDIGNNIIRTGPVSREELAAYLAAVDVGWLPLSNNGANQGRFPMKFHDFLAAGRVTVATRVGDLTNILDTEKVGILTNPEPEALAKGVLSILASNSTRREMEYNARRLAETRYSWPKVTDMLIRFYEEIIRKCSQ